MPLQLHFTQMNETCRQSAIARWFDARNGDGYRYEIGRDGHPVCRNRATDKDTWPRTAFTWIDMDVS